MDSFVDKLAQRFNAGEMIKANGEAEAMEANRLKAQADEYDRIIQEIRRLNLKTVEISEQVGQMIQCAIEQMESYDASLHDKSDSESKFRDSVSEVLNIMSTEQKTVLEEAVDIQKRMLAESIDIKQASMNRFEEHLAALRMATEESLRDMESSLRNGAKDYEPMLQELNQGLLVNKMTTEDNATQTKEMIAKLRLVIDENQKQLSEYVHKENVKVYRNVQAVINEQSASKTRELLERMENVEKKSSGNKKIMVLTFLMATAAVAIQVLQIMGIL